MIKVLIVDSRDNVATALAHLKKGETIGLEVAGGVVNIMLLQPIPFGHKLAIKDIGRGEQVMKYGEVIGRATDRIGKGEHVHVHNVEGLRGRGDWR